MYQPILESSAPYIVRSGHFSSFAAHIHHEIEILYCINGELTVTLNGIKYNLQKDSAVIIGSLTTHEILSASSDNQTLIVEFGPLFLKDGFGQIAKTDFEKPVINKTADDAFLNDFFGILNELNMLCNKNDTVSVLMRIGNLYRLSALILSNFGSIKSDSKIGRQKIEAALELIYYNYQSPITVDDAALAAGYSKSNFCRSFKLATGISFHDYLLRYRITNACYLLKNTDYSIEKIAENVGFCDTRSFCRTFKNLIGTTASEYRH